MKTTSSNWFALATLFLAPVALSAQVPLAPKAPSLGITLGLKASTLGFGPEIGFSFAPRLGVRGGFQAASVSRSLTTSGIDYSAAVKLQSVHAFLDLYLLGPLRLSAGFIRNGNKLELSATPTASVQIGDSTYQPSQVTKINGTIDFRKAAGYLGFGIGGRGRIGLIMDFGVMMQGSPQLTYTATTTLSGAAQTQFNQQVTNESTSIRADLDTRSFLKLWPVLGIGLQVKI